jgi:hypothetical protein
MAGARGGSKMHSHSFHIQAASGPSWMSVGAAPHNILRVWCQEDRLQSKFLDRLLFKHLSSSLDT